MSELEQLLKKYAPSGSELRELGSILGYEQPTKYIVHSSIYKNSNVTPVLTAGKTFILGYTNETDGIYTASKESPVMIFDDFTTSFHWVDFSFKVKSSAMKILKPLDDAVLFRFVYYAMKSIDYKPSDHVRHWISQYSKIKIPVPALEIQKKIVEILDTFSGLEADLSEQLNLEISTRHAQFTYYRDLLITGNKHSTPTDLGKLGTFKRGGGIQKKDFTPEGVGCIHYGQVFTYYGTYATETKSYISVEQAAKSRKANTGDLVIATTSENDDDVCKAVAWLGDEDIAVSGDALIFKHDQNPRFMSYFFQTTSFSDQKRRFITGTKVRRVSPQNLSKISISIPDLAEQERVANLLESFEKLTADNAEMLHAEKKTRQKQYSHYRNKLISLAELKV